MVGLALGPAVGVDVGGAAPHRPLILQLLLAQWRSNTHRLPFAHGRHPLSPPQSTSDSPPLSMPSVHNAHVGDRDGDRDGDAVGTSVKTAGMVAQLVSVKIDGLVDGDNDGIASDELSDGEPVGIAGMNADGEPVGSGISS